MSPRSPRVLPRLTFGLVLAATLLPVIARSTDVDGPNDCARQLLDFGDAPEASDAYAGVLAAFPTCTFPGPVGTQEVACIPPLSTAPGAAGAVIHTQPNDGTQFWLGCGSGAAAPDGIDSEGNGKTNSTGAAISFCDPGVTIDCVEAAFGMMFGQDECYGSTDACLKASLSFGVCEDAAFEYETYSCNANPIDAYLNILVDWNQDGDWNDNFQCPGTCAYEWAVKNEPIVVPPGCDLLTTPVFKTGPYEGRGWLRITISRDPMNDDFPWEGTLSLPGGRAAGGETEDYPVEIVGAPDDCPEYRDYGDAPEDFQAYPGVSGRFPTCIAPSAPGTQELECTVAPRSTPPATTGFVRHTQAAGSPIGFWLGCPAAGGGFPGVDDEGDGKSNDTGGGFSSCNDLVAVDCLESAFGLDFGQDECTGDADAGIDAPIEFQTCEIRNLSFEAYNCKLTPYQAYLNILVDWNQDGDWNDNFICPNGCAHEWAVKNAVVTIFPGCAVYTSPDFLTGPKAGDGWLRITLSPFPATNDFPWAGTSLMATPEFPGGETEDYPVTITGGDPCDVQYEDFGDAPEEGEAYPGVAGFFPTCLLDVGPGTQELECEAADGTPPGPTGYVRHVGGLVAPARFWLGCAVDTEANGKFNVGGAASSFCDPAVAIDCVESFWLDFGQDECYGDADAGLNAASVSLPACSLGTVTFRATNCEPNVVKAILNVLVDYNQDGDWNDNLLCKSVGYCAHEWAVINQPYDLAPGCNTYRATDFRVGPKVGPGWLRITLTDSPVPADFPWNGSRGIPGHTFRDGETEDYPVVITPSLVDAPTPSGAGRLHLAPPVPNPGTDAVRLRFTLPREGEISLEIFDPSGRRVRALIQGSRTAGEHVVTWDFRDTAGREVPNGVYLIRLRAGGEVVTQRTVHTH